MKKQYEFLGNKLVLYPKRSPKLMQGFLFLTAFAIFSMPIAATLIEFLNDKKFDYTHVIIAVACILGGYAVLRAALWNTFGKEEILFRKDKVEYFANYKWFKDSYQTVIFEGGNKAINHCGIVIEDHQYHLHIANDERTIICATKIPHSQLNEILLIIDKKL